MTQATQVQSALDAERQAHEAVEEARNQATALREEGRTRARRVEQATDARLQRLHAALDGSLAIRVKAIEDAGANAVHELHLDNVEKGEMKRIVAELVRRVIEETSGRTGPR